jgi:hypothetical protein
MRQPPNSIILCKRRVSMMISILLFLLANKTLAQAITTRMIEAFLA